MAHDINDLIGKKIIKIGITKSEVCIHVEGGLNITVCKENKKYIPRPMDYTKLKEKLRSDHAG